MSIRRSLVWSFGAQVYVSVMLFGGTVIAARLLTPREMGVFAIGFAIAAALNVFAAVGTNSYLIREEDLTADRRRTAFTFNLFVYVLLTILLLALSAPASSYLGDQGVGQVMQLLAIRPAFLVFELLPSAMLQREMRFNTIAKVQSLSATVTVVVLVGTVLAGWSYLSVGFGMVAGSIVSSIGYNLAAPEHRSIRLGLPHVHELASFSARILSISGLALLTYRVSEILVGRLLGLTALGLFSRATQLIDFLYFNLYGSATRVLFAQLAAHSRDGRSLDQMYLRSLDMITAILWPVAAGIAILAGPAVHILYGPAYSGAAAPLALLMVALATYGGFAMHWELFVIRKQADRMTRIEVVRSVVSILALLAGVQLGIAGAAAGRVVEAVLGFVFYIKWIERLAGVSTAQLVAIYIRSASLTVAACTPPLTLMMWQDWNAATAPWLVAAAVGSGIALWLCVLMLLRHHLYHEMVKFIDVLRRAVPGT